MVKGNVMVMVTTKGKKSMRPIISVNIDNIDIIDNRNITSKHLGRKGLHLNKSGSSRLAKNIIYKLRKF